MLQSEQTPKSIFRQAPMPRHKLDTLDKQAKLDADMAGDGQFVFENNTKGELFLPRPTSSGRKRIPAGQQFMGDSYYFQMVKTNELKFIREANAPMEKLITEQPPTVTRDGQIEYVTSQPQKINEDDKNDQGEILLTESPVDGIKIIK